MARVIRLMPTTSLQRQMSLEIGHYPSLTPQGSCCRLAFFRKVKVLQAAPRVSTRSIMRMEKPVFGWEGPVRDSMHVISWTDIRRCPPRAPQRKHFHLQPQCRRDQNCVHHLNPNQVSLGTMLVWCHHRASRVHCGVPKLNLQIPSKCSFLLPAGQVELELDPRNFCTEGNSVKPE